MSGLYSTVGNLPSEPLCVDLDLTPFAEVTEPLHDTGFRSHLNTDRYVRPAPLSSITTSSGGRLAWSARIIRARPWVL